MSDLSDLIARADQDALDTVVTTLPNGDREWRLDGKLHRLAKPAVEYAEGGGECWSHGIHSLTWQPPHPHPWRKVQGEAVVTTLPNGNREWRVQGKLHREDGPAVEYPDGGGEWWSHGANHRDDGPAAEWPDGTRAWYQNGQLHRLDGPALESPELLCWFYEGLPHRADGPAEIFPDGDCYWFLHGQPYRTEDEYRARLQALNEQNGKSPSPPEHESEAAS